MRPFFPFVSSVCSVDGPRNTRKEIFTTRQHSDELQCREKNLTSPGIFSALQSVRIFASREDFQPTARQPCRRGGNHERGEKHERQSTKIICVYLCPSVANFFSCVSFRFFRVFRGSHWVAAAPLQVLCVSISFRFYFAIASGTGTGLTTQKRR